MEDGEAQLTRSDAALWNVVGPIPTFVLWFFECLGL